MNLKEQGIIEHSIFSVYLSDIKDSEAKKSVILIGGYDIEKYGSGGTIQYISVYSQTGY